jgi:hypothetical protein
LVHANFGDCLLEGASEYLPYFEHVLPIKCTKYQWKQFWGWRTTKVLGEPFCHPLCSDIITGNPISIAIFSNLVTL